MACVLIPLPWALRVPVPLGSRFQMLGLGVCSKMPVILRSFFLLSIYVCYLESEILESSAQCHGPLWKKEIFRT